MNTKTKPLTAPTGQFKGHRPGLSEQKKEFQGEALYNCYHVTKVPVLAYKATRQQLNLLHDNCATSSAEEFQQLWLKA